MKIAMKCDNWGVFWKKKMVIICNKQVISLAVMQRKVDKEKLRWLRWGIYEAFLPLRAERSALMSLSSGLHSEQPLGTQTSWWWRDSGEVRVQGRAVYWAAERSNRSSTAELVPQEEKRETACVWESEHVGTFLIKQCKVFAKKERGRGAGKLQKVEGSRHHLPQLSFFPDVRLAFFLRNCWPGVFPPSRVLGEHLVCNKKKTSPVFCVCCVLAENPDQDNSTVAVAEADVTASGGGLTRPCLLRSPDPTNDSRVEGFGKPLLC